MNVPIVEVDAHARHRGPYTAAGTLVRLLVPEALRTRPDLVARHDVELLAVAPELRAVVTCRRETLTSSAGTAERTRFYPAARTLRVAHGLTEFLLALLGGADRSPTTLVVRNLDHADATDREFVDVLRRRCDPRLLRVVTDAKDAKDAKDAADVPAAAAVTDARPLPHTTRARAELFVAGECLSEDPRVAEAYQALDHRERARLHDERAEALEARVAKGEFSLCLGAVPFHRERGADPRGAGLRALTTALEYCVLTGFYDAVLDLGERSAALLDWATDPERRWLVTAKTATALSATGRVDEALAAYDEACAASTHPSVHLQAAYGRAMLYTRFFDAERRDHRQAKAWINTAIAISSLLPVPEQRTCNLTFNENGLALIEMHLGDREKALALVDAGLLRLDDELGPDQQTLHRSVLRYNRAQLLAALGRLDDAAAAYDELVAMDPCHSEYYLERAEVRRRLGRPAEAADDYDEAVRLSPPYPEAFYNRADLAMERGDLTAAAADFGRVVELDPDAVDAYANRAGALLELGDTAGAASDVATGLALAPGHAHLSCLLGRLAQDAGRTDEALAAYAAALRADPTLVAAYGNRAVLRFEAGDDRGALADLDRALELDDDPDLRENRATVLARLGWTADAS